MASAFWTVVSRVYPGFYLVCVENIVRAVLFPLGAGNISALPLRSIDASWLESLSAFYFALGSGDVR